VRLAEPPPHLLVIAGVHSAEIADLARARRVSGWTVDRAGAAEHEARAAPSACCMQRLGAPVVAVPAEALEQAVFAKYEALRRSRRV